MKRILLLIVLPFFSILISYAHGQNTLNTTDIQESETEKNTRNLMLQATVVPNNDAVSYHGGQVYKIEDEHGILVNFHPDIDEYDYELYSYLSTPNRIDFSENSITVNFAFKLPISNMTTQIERIDTTFPVNSITNHTDQVVYQGWSSIPISINGTEYQPVIFFSIPNDATSYMTIQNYLP